MRAILIALCAGLSLSAHAAPWLVADVQPEADRCIISGLPASIAATVVESGGECRWDLAGLPVGSYTVTAVAEADSNLWKTSAPSAPFAFQRPPSTSMPAGLRLVP